MNIENRPTLPPTRTGYRIDDRLPVIAMALEIQGAHRVAAHRHPRAQLIYAIRGVMRVVSRGGTWVVPPSQAVWVPSDIEHEVIATGSLSIRSLFVDPSATAGLPQSCCVVGVPPLLRELILKAVERGEAYPSTGAVRRLMDVILDQLHELQPAPLHLPLAQDKRVRHVMDALVADPADDRGLEHWAGVSGAAGRTLARLFVKETGMTFGDWRKQLRLLEAIDRLGQGQPVTRVALELGYQSPSAFIAMFRRALGTPPGRYFRDTE